VEASNANCYGLTCTECIITVRSTYNFKFPHVVMRGPRVVTVGPRVGHALSAVGKPASSRESTHVHAWVNLGPRVGMWGMLCSTAMRGKLRERKQQPDIEYNKCTKVVSTIRYVHINY